MQAQQHSTVHDQNLEDVSKIEYVEYKFCCCRCTSVERNDSAASGGGPSKGDVITQQPNSNNNNDNNRAPFVAQYDPKRVNGLDGAKHGTRNVGKMATNFKRLKEESTSVTSAVLNDLINESKEIDLKEESRRNEQNITLREMLNEMPYIEAMNTSVVTVHENKNAIGEHASYKKIESIEDTIIEDRPESFARNKLTKNDMELQSKAEILSTSEVPFELEPIQSASTEILQIPKVVISTADAHSSNSESDDDRESQIVFTDLRDSVDRDNTNKTENGIGAVEIGHFLEQTAKPASSEKNYEQTMESETELNKYGLLDDDDGTDHFVQEAESSNKFTDVLTNFSKTDPQSGKKISTEDHGISVICIPDEDNIVQRKDETQKSNNPIGIESIRTLKDQRDDKPLQSNRMYDSDISSSSSSEGEDVLGSVIFRNTENTHNSVPEEYGRTTVSIKEPKDEGDIDASDEKSIKHKTVPKSPNGAVEVFTDDEFNERLI